MVKFQQGAIISFRLINFFKLPSLRTFNTYTKMFELIYGITCLLTTFILCHPLLWKTNINFFASASFSFAINNN